MTPQQNQIEITAMAEAVAAAKNARRVMREQNKKTPGSYSFMEMRQMDLDIETLEAEIRRST